MNLVVIPFSVAVKRIREIMAGADMNSNPHSQPGIPQPQRMPVPSPMATPAFNQPLAIFDRQPLPPGVSAYPYEKNTKKCMAYHPPTPPSIVLTVDEVIENTVRA